MNFKIQIQNPDCYKNPNPNFKIENPKSKLQNPDSYKKHYL